MDIQKQEIREAIELPLIQQDLYSQIGIDPPSGVLLYGPPGWIARDLRFTYLLLRNRNCFSVVSHEFDTHCSGE